MPSGYSKGSWGNIYFSALIMSNLKGNTNKEKNSRINFVEEINIVADIKYCVYISLKSN